MKRTNLISVESADQIIRKHTVIDKTVERPLKKAYGRVLRENIEADRDLPPFNKSVVDGVAIKLDSYRKGNRSFPIQGTQSAGKQPLRLIHHNSCIEIMTGAVLPRGCDCVIPVEQTKVDGKKIIIADRLQLTKMQYIRKQGEDHKKGEILLKAGCVLLPPQISVAVSVGKTKIKVNYNPTVAIISTGDEIVGLRKRAGRFQVRNSNAYGVQAALFHNGFHRAGIFIVKDYRNLLYKMLSGALKLFDIVILSGGVSMGKFDLVPHVLEELGVKVLFHKVNQKPGKPLLFGKDNKGKIVFGLPGNPVSTQVCTYRYVLPFLKRVVGMPSGAETVCLAQKIKVTNNMTTFLPVKISRTKSGRSVAQLLNYGGSGDFSALGPSDGFVELRAGRGFLKKGVKVPLYRWNY